MAEIKTIYKGESVTLLFTFTEAYDMTRLASHKIFVGETEFTGVIEGQTIKMQLKSSDTNRMIGTHRIVCLIDDMTLGLRKPYCGDLVVAKTQASGSTTSVSNISDIIIPVVISETAITVGDILYNYVKGEKGDPFTYADFTPEQKAELQQPAADAIASIEAVEQSVEQAEALRVTAEQARQTNTATAISNAEQATDDANNAASLANEKAGLADTAATNANAITDSKPTIHNASYDIKANVETTIPSTAFVPQLNENPVDIRVFKNGILSDVTAKYVKNGDNYDILITSTIDLVGADITVFGTKINQFHYFVNEAKPRIASRDTTFNGTVKYVATTGNDTTGDGSIGNPYKTITKAYATSTNGGIIQLADGTYQTSDEAGGYILFNTSSKGILLRGNPANKSAVVLNLSVASSYMIRCRECGEMRFEHLSITTNQNTACVAKEPYGTNLNLKLYNCDISNTSTAASYYCLYVNTGYLTPDSHIESENCNFIRTGNTYACMVIQSSSNHTVLFKNCSFISTSTAISYQPGNRGKIAVYDSSFALNGNSIALSYGTDISAPAESVSLVDIRNNSVTYGAGYSSHAILLGRGLINVYCVNNIISISSIANSLAIGIAIKSTALNIGDCIIAGNIVTAPRPIYIKGGQKNIVAWNTAVCNTENNYGAFEVDNPVNPDGEKLSIGNKLLNNNLFGQVSALILYNTAASEQVNVTMQGWVVDYNYYYKPNFVWVLDVSTSIEWANKSTLWNVATTNDVNSKLVSRNEYIISETIKDVTV